ncbi:ATP-grasp domain-containing protein [Vibrio owensii]|uniref:ATP-grasp domain-containing protein n=1 Tax=Vibrio owensii TaxID=696485 RepID=UPI0005EFA8B3|nr:ATP-grasp domain-containing protein [Vibrio owensii]
MNILFTCVGRRKYLVDYFSRELANNGRVIGADMSYTAPALASCDTWYEVPSIYSDQYIPRIIDICIKENVSTVISLNDMELPLLSGSRHVFEEKGVTLVVSSDSVIDVCSDKYKTYQFCKDNDIPTPETYVSFDAAIGALNSEKVNFPLVVKPRWGSASFGIFFCNSVEELRESFERCKSSLRSSYLADFQSSLDDVLIQECIVGKEYGVDIFNDISGNYRAAVCKEKLAMRAGETDKATTVSSHRFEAYANTISTKLRHVGNMDCDFLEMNNKLYLLELNPRFGGGYPFSHEAGANLVKALLMSLDGRDNEIEISYEVNKTFAKCDTLIPARSD